MEPPPRPTMSTSPSLRRLAAFICAASFAAASSPGAAEEAEIVRRVADASLAPVDRVLGAAEIAAMRAAAESVSFDEDLAAYAVRIVRATRPASAGGRDDPAAGAPRPLELSRDVGRWVEFGASPRASIHLYRCARISALLDGRAYVLPEDVKAQAPAVLRHRLVLSYEAEAESVDADAVIARVRSAIPLP